MPDDAGVVSALRYTPIPPKGGIFRLQILNSFSPFRHDWFDGRLKMHSNSILIFFQIPVKKPSLGGNTLPFFRRIFAVALYKKLLFDFAGILGLFSYICLLIN